MRVYLRYNQWHTPRTAINYERLRMFSLRVLFIYMLLVSVSHADIKQTSDLAVVQKAILSSPQDTLVVFDVDLVLITPSDEVFIMQASEDGDKFLARIYKDLFERHSIHDVDNLQRILMYNQSWRLVTPDTAIIFNRIKDSGYKVLGLTASGTGTFGNIQSVENWRISQLKTLGVTFSNSYVDAKAGTLDQYIPGISEHYRNAKHPSFPAVKDGIIFTAFIPKGQALGAYLQYADIKPRKIIFTDDRLYNLESVQEYCKEAEIEFIGYEYTALKEQVKDLSLNTKRAKLQYKVLELTKVWLDDKQADKVLDAIKSKDG